MTSILRPWAPLAAGLTVVLAVAACPVSAQQKPMRVAVVDPSRVFSEMQETKDLRVSLEAERQRLAAQIRRRVDEHLRPIVMGHDDRRAETLVLGGR